MSAREGRRTTDERPAWNLPQTNQTGLSKLEVDLKMFKKHLNHIGICGAKALQLAGGGSLHFVIVRKCVKRGSRFQEGKKKAKIRQIYLMRK